VLCCAVLQGRHPSIDRKLVNNLLRSAPFLSFRGHSPAGSRLGVDEEGKGGLVVKVITESWIIQSVITDERFMMPVV
jgi:hypothetical protein